MSQVLVLAFDLNPPLIWLSDLSGMAELEVSRRLTDRIVCEIDPSRLGITERDRGHGYQHKRTHHSHSAGLTS
jgi:hypothetical protein